jgi:tRNA dimethylallyltransferase
MFDYMEGRMTMEEAVEKIKVNTRRYAKRQITWFKREYQEVML